MSLATVQDGHNVDIKPKVRDVDPFVEEHKYFAQNVIDRTEPHANGQRGEVVMSILDAIFESSKQDREVEL